MAESGYTPIEAYGVVGNLETCALVAPDGSIDWFPFPHVESPSILAAILDDRDGGQFRIGPAEQYETSRQYVGTTNVLETTFRTANGTATVTDFLPPTGEVDQPKKVIYRKVTCSEGTVDLEIEFEPRFDYGRAETAITSTEKGILSIGDEERTLLESPIDLEIHDDRVAGDVTLEAGDAEWFLLRCTGAEDANADPETALDETVQFWTDWAHTCDAEADCAFGGPWHDVVVRSGLVLKLLTHAETGSVLAAPTTSLPEEIGGVRNWDYRFNWLRDAGFTVQALLNLGHVEEAVNYFEWFLNLCQTDEPEKIQPLYGLHGRTDLEERELDHLAGYRNSRPVRIGNGAVDQTQLDIYGELLLAIDEMLRHGRELDDEEWSTVSSIVEYAGDAWEQNGAGIWEVRGGARHFVYSKVMCWVALDRGIEIASDYGYDAPLEEWRDTRETIKTDVIENGYDEDVGAFVQAYDSDALDATGLLLPIVGFLPFDDERIQGTIEAIENGLVEDQVLVHRYDGDDGLPGEEGAFVLCSCWLIDALALSGRVDEACERFEALLEYVSPLGLLAEEVDTNTGAHLGNYPQGFSHIGIINSALYVGYAQGQDSPGASPMGIRLGDPILPERE
ncbi:glycoside hydrolase family 15 protein [Halalkalicoccus ordinarius]|uniref:glycoside hydrolase family 15 protein n=1 Tax=Halalkalicoccus ordinarius TaxID=3116651 RepID=UPI00300F2CB1